MATHRIQSNDGTPLRIDNLRSEGCNVYAGGSIRIDGDGHLDVEFTPRQLSGFLGQYGGVATVTELDAPITAPEAPVLVDLDAPVEPDEADDYDAWSKAELVDACAAAGLPVSGTKAVLIARLRDSD